MKRIALVAALLLGGCVHAEDIKPSDGVVVTVASHTYEEVWNAGIRTVASIGRIESTNESTGEIRGFRDGSSGLIIDYGNALGVFIYPTGPAEQYQVSIVGVKSHAQAAFQNDYTNTMVQLFKANLKKS